MDYVQEARKIITDYFTAMKPSEQLLKEAADELAPGPHHGSLRQRVGRPRANEQHTLRNNAWSQLEALLRKFALAAGLADAPNGDALQGGDYKLLADNFPMSAEEFAVLCERNKNNPTLLRKAMEYGNKNGGLAPTPKNITALPMTGCSCSKRWCSVAARCWMQSRPAPPAATPIGT